MSERRHPRGPVAPAMNITPLIDVVFLLIVFFMLASNLVAEQREPMMVPHPHDPQARRLAQQDRVIVNVLSAERNTSTRRADPLRAPGQARQIKIGLRRFNVTQLQAVTAMLSRVRAHNPDIELLLRADAALHYRAVRPVMDAIRRAGIEKISLVTSLENRPLTPNRETPQ